MDYDLNKKSSVGIWINGYINNNKKSANNSSVLQVESNNSGLDSSANTDTKSTAIISSPSVNVYYKITLDSTGKELTVNGDYMHYSKNWTDNFTNSYYDSKGNEYLSPTYLKDNSPANINVYDFATDYVQITPKAKWEIGLKATYTITDNNIFWQTYNSTGWVIDHRKTNHFIYKENVNAAYVNYIRSIKKWNVQSGIRIEQTNSIGNSITVDNINKRNLINWFPSITIGFTQNQNNVLGFSYRKSIQRFGFDYANPFIIYQNQYSYKQGNPNLQPQINHQFSINYSLKNNLLVGIDYVHSIKSLGISFISTGDTTISTYDNFKGSDIYYSYVNYNKTLFSIWQFNANVAIGYFNYHVNTVSNNQQDNKKPFFGVQATNIFDFKKGWITECNLNYLSSLVSGIFKRKPYYSINIGTSKSLLKKKFIAKISVADAFNTQKMVMHVNYQGVIMDKNFKEESRFVTLTFKYFFGNKNVRNKKIRESKLIDINKRINN